MPWIIVALAGLLSFSSLSAQSSVATPPLGGTQASPRDVCTLDSVICHGERKESKKRILSPEEIIEYVALTENYNPDILLALAQCESSMRPNVRGVVDSRDRGLFQISSRWHPEVSDECSFDPWCATHETIRILKQRGLKEWVCGRKLNN